MVNFMVLASRVNPVLSCQCLLSPINSLSLSLSLNTKNHSGLMEVPNISDKTHNFEISPTLADLCHMGDTESLDVCG